MNHPLDGEIQKKRPAVIISNNAANTYLNRLQVVPLTSNVENIYPSEAFVVVNGKQNKAMADQLTTVSKTRLLNRIGKVTEFEMRKIEIAIKVQLGMSQE